jgi:hypothetical protein
MHDAEFVGVEAGAQHNPATESRRRVDLDIGSDEGW